MSRWTCFGRIRIRPISMTTNQIPIAIPFGLEVDLKPAVAKIVPKSIIKWMKMVYQRLPVRRTTVAKSIPS
ncbi:hypothetical protein ABPH35_08925 [Streptococcus sp. ZJ93]|uniref:hypothetical protein n=1 Tax=Streptococcus handemini TaxID=3161188 RepID=UPI0034D6E04B